MSDLPRERWKYLPLDDRKAGLVALALTDTRTSAGPDQQDRCYKCGTWTGWLTADVPECYRCFYERTNFDSWTREETRMAEREAARYRLRKAELDVLNGRG